MITGIKKYERRNSNIEMLRIISIFLIVLSHWAVHSNFSFPEDRFSLNQFIVEVFSKGELGVCIFVLISGFYSVKQTQSIGGFLKLLLKIWIYNICILLIVQVGGIHRVSLENVLHSIVPIYRTHWFAYAFLILYILMPYINKLANNLGKMSLGFCFLHYLSVGQLFFTLTGADLEFSYLGWFIYLLGAYIRIYDLSMSAQRWKTTVAICIILLVLSCLLINLIGLKLGFYPEHGTHFFSLHSPILLILAVALFKLFQKKDERKVLAINLIASTAFGI